MRINPLNFNKCCSTALLITIFFLAGCGKNDHASTDYGQESAILHELEIANRLMFADQAEEAISRLEVLHNDYPQAQKVIEALAFAYYKKQDYAAASLYFDQILEENPSRSYIESYAAQAHLKAGHWALAAEAYEQFLSGNPNDTAAWEGLAEAHYQLNQLRPALDAYLNAFGTAGNQPDLRQCTRLGTLFLRLNNYKSANEWFKRALALATGPSEYRVNCLMGLLEIAWLSKDLPRCRELVAAINRIDSGILAESKLEWVTEAVISSALTESEHTPTALIATVSDSFAEPAEIEPDQHSGGTITAQVSPTNTSSNPIQLPAPTSADIPAERRAVVLHASSSQKYPPLLESNELSPSLPQKTVDPGLAAAADTTTVPKIDPFENNSANDGYITIVKPEPVSDVHAATEDLSPFDLAKACQLADKYAEAIEHYQAILIDNPESATACFELSRTYYLNENWKAAQLYASEALRIDPDNVAYTLNFLRNIQKTQNQEQLIKELLKAKEKFPNNPEITLALAQCYERLLDNQRNAKILYEEFLNLTDSEHPDRMKAEIALGKL